MYEVVDFQQVLVEKPVTVKVEQANKFFFF